MTELRILKGGIYQGYQVSSEWIIYILLREAEGVLRETPEEEKVSAIGIRRGKEQNLPQSWSTL